MIDKNDPRLTAYLLGELSRREVETIEAAIDDSPELREHIVALQNTIDILNRACDVDFEEETLSDQQLQQLTVASAGHVALKNDTDTGIAARIRWRNFVIAALILYAVGISVFAFRQPTPVTTMGVPSEPAAVTFEKSRGVNINTSDGFIRGGAALTDPDQRWDDALQGQANTEPSDEGEREFALDPISVPIDERGRDGATGASGEIEPTTGPKRSDSGLPDLELPETSELADAESALLNRVEEERRVANEGPIAGRGAIAITECRAATPT